MARKDSEAYELTDAERRDQIRAVLAEAHAMAAASGIDTATFVDQLRGADAGLLRPLTHRIGERLARRDFSPGMRTDAARKDSVLALEMAQDFGIPLFAIQAAHTVYEQACAREMGALVATLRANLPALITAEIAYGKRIGGDATQWARR